MCCDPSVDKDKCKSAKEKMLGICSNDNPDAPPSFKYFACPNEEGCGERKIIPVRSLGDNKEKVRR